ncbi:DNA primase [Novosphingobium umbonatum]|uniref:DNA primase n=1 Tax=Novosphingobium umbonatum TaxID=1908524 RepID=A0A3S2UVJ8_9SPHN|nr:DNA primase [Novosphingobium umbonatum]RVU06187.1 DNA primase [Novosphingobium umbonatum]
MSLSPQFLDELRSRITLSGVIGRTVRVIKAGREFKACCPFHNEKSPSFTINDEKGFYHCFGCGAHGDVIRWMTDQRGMSFIDAVKDLAEEAGMELPAPDPQFARQQAQRAEQQKTLHDCMGAAQGWFVDQLSGEEGARARAYLATRGFSAAVCREFGFGYAPEGRQALKGALTQFPEPMLIEAGLRIAVEDKEPYDRFRGRLMLPIHDARGRVIAFGGRILDKTKTDAPKYLNSPDTPLFDKGRTLYNHHRASPASRQSKRLIVVEGYMDVIALAAAGFGESVAPLGTALTETQIEMLWRMVPVPVLCFDGDAAGQRAAMRAISRALPLLRPGHSLRIVRMPQGQDPDDLIKAQGPAAMEELLEGAQGLLDALWQFERDASPAATPEDKAGLKARLMAHVDTIADNDIKALYRRDLLERFSDFAFPRRESGGFNQRNFTRNAPARPQRAGGRGNWRDLPSPNPLPETAARLQRRPGDEARSRTVEAVVAGLMRRPDLALRHGPQLARLAAEDARIDAILDHVDSGAPLETGAIEAIFNNRGLSMPSGEPQRDMAFSFLQHSDETAAAELGDVLCVLVDIPETEAAKAQAMARYAQELTPEAEAEHKRLQERLQDLRKRELDLRARLGQMASAQAAVGDPAQD